MPTCTQMLHYEFSVRNGLRGRDELISGHRRNHGILCGPSPFRVCSPRLLRDRFRWRRRSRAIGEFQPITGLLLGSTLGRTGDQPALGPRRAANREHSDRHSPCIRTWVRPACSSACTPAMASEGLFHSFLAEILGISQQPPSSLRLSPARNPDRCRGPLPAASLASLGRGMLQKRKGLPMLFLGTAFLVVVAVAGVLRRADQPASFSSSRSWSPRRRRRNTCRDGLRRRLLSR